MDKKIEEIIRKKSRKPSTDLEELLSKGESCVSDSTTFDVKDGVVIKLKPTEFPACPIIDVADDHYFYTIDGRTLVFRPEQKSPYIFVPFPLRKAIFYRSGEKIYFVTLDTSNKLQFSVFVNGYPSDERHIISRNVTQVIHQSGKIFYISTKNEYQHVNSVTDEGGVLRGRMCVPGIKAKLNLNIFCANGVLFLNIENQFQKEDGKKLQIQGQQICGIGDGFLVLDIREEISFLLLDDKYQMLDNHKMSCSGREIRLFPLGGFVGVVAGSVIYILGVASGKLRVETEIQMDVPPLCLDLSLKEKSLLISKIVPCECGAPGEDAASVSKNTEEEMPSQKEASKNLNEDVSRTNKPSLADFLNEANEVGVKKGGLQDIDGLDSLSRYNFAESDLSQHADGFTGNISVFEPYSPDRSSGELAALSKKLDSISKMQEDIRDRMKSMEDAHNERSVKLLKATPNLNEGQIKSVIHESMKKELSHVSESLKSIEQRISEGLSESVVLESVKKIVIGTLVPVVEACMDEMRIQVVNEMSLIQNEDHLKGVKKAVDCMHGSFNKQNEIRSLLTRGMVDRAADAALKGPSSNMEAFISSVETSCLERLSSPVLLALLEKVLVMSKDDFKVQYQDFVYMLMVCLDIDELSDEEIQVLNVLMAYINNIDGVFLNEGRLSAIVEFYKIKLSKLRSRGSK